MDLFEDQEDLEEWLETLSYEEFWQETDPNGLDWEERANCDLSIERGVKTETILRCIKAAKRLEIIKEQNLKPRDIIPPLTVH